MNQLKYVFYYITFNRISDNKHHKLANLVMTSVDSLLKMRYWAQMN